MGAVPNKKLTGARKGSRFNSHKLKPVNSSVCPRCRGAKWPHAVCRHCGYYRGRLVIEASA